MKRDDARKRWGSGVFLLAALLCGAVAWSAHMEACGMQRQTSYYLQEGMSVKEAQRISDLSAETAKETEAGGLDLCIWGEAKGQSVQAERTGATTETDVVQIYGSSEWLFPGSVILQSGDEEGCLIGADTARELFGSHGVIGEQISWNGRVRTIRGIVRRPGRLLAVSGPCDEESVSLNRITAGCTADGANSDGRGWLAMVCGVSAESLRWDYLSGWNWLGELIPGKWSDFEGWRTNLREKERDFGRLLEIEKSATETLYLHTCAKGFFLGVASLCFLAAAFLTKKSFYNFPP